MHSLTYASPAFKPASPQASSFGHAHESSRNALETGPSGYRFDPISRSANDDVRLSNESTNLDGLISDISKLARSYMDRGDLGGTAPAGSSSFAERSAVHPQIQCNDSGASSNEDNTKVLDAVYALLGSALEKMRGPLQSPESGSSAPVTPARPRGGIAPSALRRVREHIDKNLGEHIEIADLASLTGLSPCHFSRAFKQSMGMPPHRYLISRRVKEAVRLIETTDLPMFEIALDVGFSDQSHFTRVFSAQVGESPSQFRHQRR